MLKGGLCNVCSHPEMYCSGTCVTSPKHFTAAGDASNKGAEEETATYSDEENPFSLLRQPPSKFSPLPPEENIPQSSSDPSLPATSLVKYLKNLHSQPVCENELTLSRSKEQPISNQRTQYDISGKTWLFIHFVHFLIACRLCCICAD